MLLKFLTFVILGFVLALPVGAITIEMSKQGLKNGFFHGWMVGIGGMTIDLIMISIIYFGLSAFLTLDTTEMVMSLIGCIFLIYIGSTSIKEAKLDISYEGNAIKRPLWKSYITGILMAASPGGIVFWLGIFGTALTTTIQDVSGLYFFIVAAGILLGILIHDIVLLAIIHYSRSYVNPNFIRWTSIIAGVLLMAYGSYFGFLFLKSWMI